ncbi:hypothetical protein JT358_15545 [Micrococcales bacterium 31B]|nr:hypothetical protein [Micrococcales bacterium 31B]
MRRRLGSTTANPADAVLDLVIEDGQGPQQYRISRVQILNWGAYDGLQAMEVSRTGIAIVGPSGRGKSTLLDAMASVILPNPQEFNQAARDDRGKKRERTVYSYARGQTDQRQDRNRASATTNYLRPPGSKAFASGAAITWQTARGDSVTLVRLVWVSPETDTHEAINANTIYGFIHGEFSLATLNGMKPPREGTSPLSRSSLERYINTERGDLFDRSQAAVHAKLRAVMRMGSNEKSQALAMQLLRRAQASKGIYSINDLFKEFVLTEPEALKRWDITLESFLEATKLYDEFEFARQRRDHLRPLRSLAADYREAAHLLRVKQRLLREDSARLELWHAENMARWAAESREDALLDLAHTTEGLDRARGVERSAALKQKTIMGQIAASGGNNAVALRELLASRESEVQRVLGLRDTVARALAAHGVAMPDSEGEATLTLAILAELATEEQAKYDASVRDDNLAQVAAGQATARARECDTALQALRSRRSLIPEDAHERRARIAAALQISVDDLPYAGELMQVKASQRRWSKAVTGVARGLASTLLVAERDLARVRTHVNDHDMRGVLTFTSVTPVRGEHRVPETHLAAVLELAEHPYSAWLEREVAQQLNYVCVERVEDLDRAPEAGTRGYITAAGLRTGRRGRYTKDDSNPRFTWIGWDNRALIADLERDLEASRREEHFLRAAAEATQKARDQAAGRLRELEATRRSLVWHDLDPAPALEAVEAVTQQLDATTTPEAQQLALDLEAAQSRLTEASVARSKLEDHLTATEQTVAALGACLESANALVERSQPLEQGERAALASLRWRQPALVAEGAAILTEARSQLGAQVGQHTQAVENLTSAITGRLQGYRGIDERTARETDGSLETLDDMLAVLDQLETDDLPRAKSAWLAKVNDDMNKNLRALLTQIDEDARVIQRGLAPINDVLRNVRFRQSSTLGIVAQGLGNGDLVEFRRVVTEYTSHAFGTDEAEVERRFVALRARLAPLTEASRRGESWRARVFDAREHAEFKAIETRADGVQVVHDGVSGMSGGEGQELIAFILGAALRFRLSDERNEPPLYASVILDEGFVKSDSEYTGRSLAALQALGFQVIVGAPREKATAFEGFVESVAYINSDPGRAEVVRIYPMTMREALGAAVEVL